MLTDPAGRARGPSAAGVQRAVCAGPQSAGGQSHWQKWPNYSRNGGQKWCCEGQNRGRQ